MVDTEHIVAMGKIDPTQAAPPRSRLQPSEKAWLAAGILIVLALGHGKLEYARWSTVERARYVAETKRQADAAVARIVADAAAAKSTADEDIRGTVRAEPETLTTATLHARPEPDPRPRSTVPAAAIVPAPPCDEAQVAIDRHCPGRKDSFKDCPECPEMVVVPAGEVMMGSRSNEEGRAGNEGPQHKVTIEKQFAVSKFETTFAEWGACVLAGGCKHTPNDQGWGRGRRPVVDVSWEDARAYATWLSRETGLKYRLLTEAEWEYAARAGTTTAFSTGEMITGADANFDGSHAYGGSRKGQYRKSTVEVGSFLPNAFGLHDMHGNVWEWVEDCWHTDYKGGPSDGSSWTNRCNERSRALRGGSWIDPPRILRSAYRSRNVPGYRGGTVGFRVARTLD
jgi:formylglycine-generating enzyme required for sulfatase activity